MAKKHAERDLGEELCVTLLDAMLGSAYGRPPRCQGGAKKRACELDPSRRSRFTATSRPFNVPRNTVPKAPLPRRRSRAHPPVAPLSVSTLYTSRPDIARCVKP